MNEPHDQLTPQGAARREAMLGELTGAMTRRHRRRRSARRMASIVAVTLLAFSLFRISQPPSMDARLVTVSPSSVPVSVDISSVRVEWVSTDTSVATRSRGEPRPLIVHIDDAQLLHTLVEIGRPAGLIHIGERVALSAPVTDDELNGAAR